MNAKQIQALIGIFVAALGLLRAVQEFRKAGQKPTQE